MQGQKYARQLALLRMVADISNDLTSNLHLDSLVHQAVDQIQDRFGLYFVGIFLVDESGKKALLSSGSGEIGSRLVNDKFSLPVGENSLVGWSISNGKPRISPDLNNDPLHMNNPDLPLSRSEIALPLLHQNKILGAMSLQANVPGNFAENDTFIYQNLADNFVTAYVNADQFQKSQADLKEVSSLYRKSLEHTWSEVATTTDGLSFTFENPDSLSGQSSVNSFQLPLTLRDQLIGQITMEMGKDSLTPEELAFIDNVSIQTSLALENARLLEETQRQVSREQLINRVSDHFSRAVNIDEILKAVLQEISQLPSVSEASVFLTTAQDFGPYDAKKPEIPLE
jgi:GAF domain-containing protein